MIEIFKHIQLNTNQIKLHIKKYWSNLFEPRTQVVPRLGSQTMRFRDRCIANFSNPIPRFLYVRNQHFSDPA